MTVVEISNSFGKFLPRMGHLLIIPGLRLFLTSCRVLFLIDGTSACSKYKYDMPDISRCGVVLFLQLIMFDLILLLLYNNILILYCCISFLLVVMSSVIVLYFYDRES